MGLLASFDKFERDPSFVEASRSRSAAAPPLRSLSSRIPVGVLQSAIELEGQSGGAPEYGLVAAASTKALQKHLATTSRLPPHKPVRGFVAQGAARTSPWRWSESMSTNREIREITCHRCGVACLPCEAPASRSVLLLAAEIAY